LTTLCAGCDALISNDEAMQPRSGLGGSAAGRVFLDGAEVPAGMKRNWCASGATISVSSSSEAI
jgi:hypothetical protein